MHAEKTSAALYEEAKLELFVEPWALGQDRISAAAPCIIMACAPRDERTAPPAAMINPAIVWCERKSRLVTARLVVGLCAAPPQP